MAGIQRVRYQKCPLIEVIFQLRFPTILKIGANLPEELQEKIKEKYPLFDETIEQVGEVNFVNGQQIPINKQNKNYLFASEDEKQRVNLTPNFIAVTTHAYTQWEDFREQINFVVKNFEDIYHPQFYSRVGLRYEDAITRSKLGLEREKWSNLIRPHILGIMSDEREEGTLSYLSTAEFDNGDKTNLRTHFELVHINNAEEISFLIDCDYFCLEKTEINEMTEISERLHTHSTNFIRDAITEKLHEAMDPVEISVK